ncbi:MAG TPA: TolC family protein [Vicinamibacterales bacterium]|nr:TolC family protein [Vicinamibacterales bacterium]
MKRFLCAAAVAAGALVAADAMAQPPEVFTLDRAIQYATDHYPTIKAALEQVNASSAGVDVARSAYLPRFDSLWQSNRGTANNIFGQLLPQSVIPSMSGPVLPSASAQSVWGSAVGGLLSWEPFDFGLRRASVVGAQAALTQARAGESLTRVDVQNAVAAAFLDVLAAERTVTAERADLERRNVLLQSVQTLVTNQLRPGADQSRAEAERAAAQTRLIQAQQILAIAQTRLTRVLGVTTGGVTIEGESLLGRLPPTDIPAVTASAHPLAQVRQATLDQARAEEDVLARTDLPRVVLQSSVFARGSGANADGIFDGGVDGLGLDRANWAAGVQVVFPNLFDFSALRARKAAALASTRASAALYDEALLTITNEQQTAAALLQSTRAVAANTPVQLAAAQQSETQASARYRAGLANLVEVADAQSLLAQAELQDQLARVDVWRALLSAAVARGDLTPLVNLVRQP